jgi:O-antigen/teichoic acid export membrane protein
VKGPAKNIGAFLFGDAATRLFGFVVNVYLARYLGPEGYGIVGMGLALIGQLSFFASPGMSVFEVRTAAALQGADPTRVGAVVSLRALLAMMVSFATWVVVRFWLASSPGGTVAVLFVVALLPMSLFLDWFFQAKEKMWPVSTSRILHYAIYMVGVILLVRSPQDVLFAPIAYLIGAWASAVYLQVLYLRWYGALLLRWSPRLWLQILRENLPVGMAMLLGQSTVNLPPLVLGAITGMAAVGTFTAALKVGIVFLMVDRLLNTLLLPVMTRYITTKGEESTFLIQMVLKVAVAVVMPMALTGILMAGWIVGIVYGSGYEESVLPLQVLMGYVSLTVLNSIFVSILLGAGKTREYLTASFIGASCMAVLLLALTPLAGTIGAATAMGIGECTLLVLMARKAGKMGGLPPVAPFAPLLLSGAGMGLAAWGAGTGGPVIALLSGLGAYSVLLFVLRTFGRREIDFLRERFV